MSAATSVSDRAGRLRGAFTAEGELTALHFENIANMGAFVRPPEPASLYRMHSTSNGAYRVANIRVDNTIVVTNTTPVGLNRGYGGPQFLLCAGAHDGKWRAREMSARSSGDQAAQFSLPRLTFPTAVRRAPCLIPAILVPSSTSCCALLTMVTCLTGAKRHAPRDDCSALGLRPAPNPLDRTWPMSHWRKHRNSVPNRRQKSGAAASATLIMDPTGQATLRPLQHTQRSGPCNGCRASRRRRFEHSSRCR